MQVAGFGKAEYGRVSSAPVDTYYYPTRFNAGQAVQRSFDVLFGNIVPFLVISAVATLPEIAYEYLSLQRTVSFYTWVPLLLRILLSSVCEAAILYAAFQALRGRPVDMGASVARGLQRFVPVVIASILTTLVITLGSLLLVVPGLIAYTILAVTLPACVVEKLGPIDSMSRSSELTRGYRWPIFGTLFAVGIVEVIVGAIVGALTRHPDTLLVYAIVLFVVSTAFRAYETVLVAIIYHDLRVVKDGIDLEHIASVFD